RGGTDLCGWEGSVGGDGLRGVIELGAGGVEILERTDGGNHLRQLGHDSPTSSVRSFGDGTNNSRGWERRSQGAARRTSNEISDDGLTEWRCRCFVSVGAHVIEY